MKIFAKRRAFYNGQIINIGQEIEYNGESVPSWAIKAKTNKSKQNKTTKNKYVQTQLPLNDVDKSDIKNITDNNINVLKEDNTLISEKLNKELNEMLLSKEGEK